MKLRLKRYALCLLAFYGAGVFFMCLDYSDTAASGGQLDLKSNVGPDLAWWTLYGLCTPFLLWVVRRHPLTAGVPRRKFVYYAAAVFAASTAHIALMLLLLPRQFSSVMGEVLNNIAFDLFFGCAIISILLGMQYYKTVYEESVAAANLEMSLARAEVEALSTHVQPEVLFTTLNAIASLACEDPARVERCIVMLSEFLRVALQREAAPEVPLDRELTLLEQYADIINVVSYSRCTVASEVTGDARLSLVPPFLCQEIVHRLIAHALATQSTRQISLRVHRRMDTLSLTFQLREGDVQTVDRVIAQSRNRLIEDRLLQLYRGDASIELNDDGTSIVTIPFRSSIGAISQKEERSISVMPLAN